MRINLSGGCNIVKHRTESFWLSVTVPHPPCTVRVSTRKETNVELNPNYYQDTDEPVACDECGHPCHADDAVTDGNIALCGSLRGNGCADRIPL